MQVIHLGEVMVEVEVDCVTTTLPDGSQIYGQPHDTAEYAQTARDNGYGDDVARMNRCHEIAHSMLAYWFGLKCSPIFARLSNGLLDETEVTRKEEEAVMAVERFANAMGVDLERIARDQDTTTTPARGLTQ